MVTRGKIESHEYIQDDELFAKGFLLAGMLFKEALLFGYVLIIEAFPTVENIFVLPFVPTLLEFIPVV
jgi:hypothetical protein